MDGRKSNMKSSNCFTVCNMEIFDPLGIYTGDSIVVSHI